jgi:hypothetical protein
MEKQDSPITLDDVKTFYKKKIGYYQSALDLLTNAVNEKQKEKKLPIYIIKSRIKAGPPPKF